MPDLARGWWQDVDREVGIGEELVGDWGRDRADDVMVEGTGVLVGVGGLVDAVRRADGFWLTVVVGCRGVTGDGRKASSMGPAVQPGGGRPPCGTYECEGGLSG